MSAGDPFYAARYAFHLGAPQTCISEAAQVTGLDEEAKVAREVLSHRAYIDIGSCEVVLNEVGEGEGHPSLKAVRLLALLAKDGKTGNVGNLPGYVDEVKSWMEDASMCRNETAMVASATVLLQGGDPEGALKACFLGGGLDNLGMAVQISLGMNRLDVAEGYAGKMSEIDDDSPLTQLAHAWIGSRKGGKCLQDAYYTIQELGDRFAWTAKLHNSLACMQMLMGRWEDAEAELLQALEKNPKDSDTLGNLSVVSQYLGKTKESARYAGMVGPDARMEEASRLFDEMASRVG